MRTSRRAMCVLTPDYLREILDLDDSVGVNGAWYDTERDLIHVYLIGDDLPAAAEGHQSQVIRYNGEKV